MIPPLTPEHIREVLHRGGTPTAGDWDLDEIATAISHVQATLLRDREHSSAPSQILTGAAITFIAASQFADPRRMRGPRSDWPGPTLALLNDWLSGLGLRLPADTELAARSEAVLAAHAVLRAILIDPATNCDTAMNRVRQWLSETMLTDAGQSFADLQLRSVTDPWPQGFLGCSLTALGYEEIDQQVEDSRSLTDVLRNLGIDAAAPALRTGVGTEPARPGVGLADERDMSQSVLSIVLMRGPSTGIGYLMHLAALCHIPTLVFTDLPDIGPLPGRHERTTVTVKPLSGDVPAAVREYVTCNWVTLMTLSCDLALKAARWQEQISKFTASLDDLPNECLTACPPLGLTKDRFHELLSSPHLWGRATRDETEQLDLIVPPPLAEPARQALELAALEKSWPRARVQYLAHVAQLAEIDAEVQARVLEMSRRHSPDQPAYWYRLSTKLQ